MKSTYRYHDVFKLALKLQMWSKNLVLRSNNNRQHLLHSEAPRELRTAKSRK